MRVLAGFLLAHGVLVAAGLGLLRALGLAGPGRRSTIAALGPALLAGVTLVVALLIALLVVGVPLSLWTAGVVGVGCAAAGFGIARRREEGEPTERGSVSESPRSWSINRGVIAVAGVYAAFGAYAYARLPTVSDDARIWSLKGLALTYYGRLRLEIFDSSFTVRAHPVYPLLQPVFEAVLFRAMGRPELRLFHAELWLLCGAAIWTAAYLLSRADAVSKAALAWVAPLALLAMAPQALANVGLGYADTTGSIVLAVGALALGLWIERGDAGYLGLAAVLLAAAANIKDEDMVGAGAIVAVAAVVALVRREPGRLRAFAAFALAAIALVLPWRIWVSAHGLSDSVTPPLPHALSPLYILSRHYQIHISLTAMISDVLGGYGWIAAIFLALCVVCLVTGTVRRIAWFYLGAFFVIVAALVWLYATTPISLGFLIPTSMDRTVSVFMALAAFASAHLLAALAAASVRGNLPREKPTLSDVPPVA